jgi:hypothetical protein
VDTTVIIKVGISAWADIPNLSTSQFPQYKSKESGPNLYFAFCLITFQRGSYVFKVEFWFRLHWQACVWFSVVLNISLLKITVQWNATCLCSLPWLWRFIAWRRILCIPGRARPRVVVLVPLLTAADISVWNNVFREQHCVLRLS